MAIKNRIPVQHNAVFPDGAYLQSEVEPVTDFKAKERPDGTKPQKYDQESGLPMWQVVVIDGDKDARKRDVAVTVKFAASHRPVPPENKSGLPWIPVEFEGLSAYPYVEKNGDYTRVAWTFLANGMKAPNTSSRPTNKEAA